MGSYYRLPTKKNNLLIVNLLLLLLLFLAGVGYLVEMNSIVVSGFKLQAARERLGVLSSEGQDLKNQQLALESYQQMDQKLQSLKLVPIDQINYVNISPEVLAKK